MVVIIAKVAIVVRAAGAVAAKAVVTEANAAGAAVVNVAIAASAWRANSPKPL